MLAPRNPECLCKPTTVMNGAMLTQPAKLVGLFFSWSEFVSSAGGRRVSASAAPLLSIPRANQGGLAYPTKNAKKHQSKPYAFPLDSASLWHALLWFAWPFSMHASHGLVWGKTERKPIQCPFWTCCPPELRHDGEMDPMVGWVLWRKVCTSALLWFPLWGLGCRSLRRDANLDRSGPIRAQVGPPLRPCCLRHRSPEVYVSRT
jgi:hypothetical protein